MQCPHCQQKVSRPAREGGVFLKARYVRLTREGALVMACAECGAESEQQARTGRLVLYRRPHSERLSEKPSSDD